VILGLRKHLSPGDCGQQNQYQAEYNEGAATQQEEFAQEVRIHQIFAVETFLLHLYAPFWSGLPGQEKNAAAGRRRTQACVGSWG
jgi:hypothetical protein